jgi:hypothetical protein
MDELQYALAISAMTILIFTFILRLVCVCCYEPRYTLLEEDI